MINEWYEFKITLSILYFSNLENFIQLREFFNKVIINFVNKKIVCTY